MTPDSRDLARRAKIETWRGSYITRVELRERGWTDGQVKRLLINADADSNDNPHLLPIERKRDIGTKLYLRSRVHEIESTSDWTPGRTPKPAQEIDGDDE